MKLLLLFCALTVITYAAEVEVDREAIHKAFRESKRVQFKDTTNVAEKSVENERFCDCEAILAQSACVSNSKCRWTGQFCSALKQTNCINTANPNVASAIYDYIVIGSGIGGGPLAANLGMMCSVCEGELTEADPSCIF